MALATGDLRYDVSTTPAASAVPLTDGALVYRPAEDAGFHAGRRLRLGGKR
jgi:hypothetical protein